MKEMLQKLPEWEIESLMCFFSAEPTRPLSLPPVRRENDVEHVQARMGALPLDHCAEPCSLGPFAVVQSRQMQIPTKERAGGPCSYLAGRIDCGGGRQVALEHS